MSAENAAIEERQLEILGHAPVLAEFRERLEAGRRTGEGILPPEVSLTVNLAHYDPNRPNWNWQNGRFRANYGDQEHEILRWCRQRMREFPDPRQGLDLLNTAVLGIGREDRTDGTSVVLSYDIVAKKTPTADLAARLAYEAGFHGRFPTIEELRARLLQSSTIRLTRPAETYLPIVRISTDQSPQVQQPTLTMTLTHRQPNGGAFHIEIVRNPVKMASKPETQPEPQQPEQPLSPITKALIRVLEA